jgi:hypothetical protein
VSERPSAEELLERPHAHLNRSHLAELGFGRNAIDAIFRALPVFVPPGYSRPMISVPTTSSSSPSTPTPTTASASAGRGESDFVGRASPRRRERAA